MKKSKNISGLATSRLRNNYGQAVIEYTLMLVVSVSFVLALSMYIFKPFGEFVSNYMGKYVGCLLEYGELPTMGSDLPSGPDDDSECNKQFKPVTIANGRPPSSGSGGSSGKDSSANKSDSKSSRSSSSSSDGGGSGTYAGSASRGGSGNILGARRPTGNAESGSSAGSGKVIEIALDGGGSSTFFKGSSDGGGNRVRNQKTHYIPISGLTEADQKNLKKKTENGGRLAVPSEGLGSAPKKTLVKKPPIKTVTKEEEPFTIGNFMRYLLIAAIIIALLIFIGGQALQMSKSFEK